MQEGSQGSTRGVSRNLRTVRGLGCPKTTTNPQPGFNAARCAERPTTRACSSADDLNAKYGIKDSIKFETNEHGLVKAVLTHFNGR